MLANIIFMFKEITTAIVLYAVIVNLMLYKLF